MTLRARFGAFFFFLGFLALVGFFARNQAGIPSFGYFCIGSVLFIGGIYLMWKYRNPPVLSERFSSYRKMQENRRKKHENLEKAKYASTEERGRKEG